MILKFDKFVGRVKKDSLDKEEVIELVSLITDMKPSLPQEIETDHLSKLIDNINYYQSEDGKYKISVYFRESDVYKNDDGSVTYGKFKSLFKVTISKSEGDIKIGEVKEFITTSSDIIKTFYTDSKFIIKIGEERMFVDNFNILDDSKSVENIKLIIRII